jgi:hypothetical protein
VVGAEAEPAVSAYAGALEKMAVDTAASARGPIALEDAGEIMGQAQFVSAHTTAVSQGVEKGADLLQGTVESLTEHPNQSDGQQKRETKSPDSGPNE